MILEILIQQYNKDLDRLSNEISAYKSESVLWSIEGEIKNSGGNLAIHLIGNLLHFIGHVLGGSDYERDRPFEFAGKDVPVSTILSDIAQTKEVVQRTLENLDPAYLDKPFPIQVFQEEYSTGRFLVHLSNHLNYHLGQINYHRRLLD